MKQSIAHVALVVNDYDEAIAFYTQKLNFTLIEDTPLSPEKRWVIISPPGANECSLLLAKASGKKQVLAIKPEAGFSYSYLRMTFGGTITAWLKKASTSFVRLKKRSMGK